MYNQFDYDIRAYDNNDCHINYSSIVLLCGLIDGPVQLITVPRTEDINLSCVKNEIDTLKKALIRYLKNYPHPMSSIEVTEHTLEFNKTREVFVNTPFEELYVVSVNDCEELNPPFIDPLRLRPDNANWAKFSSEWDVLCNCSTKNLDVLAIWDRRKQKIIDINSYIKPLPAIITIELKPFSVDPRIKENIDELLLKKDIIHDRDNAPYRLVIEQDDINKDLINLYAILAAKKFMALIGGHKPNYVLVDDKLKWKTLSLSLTEWDDWHKIYNLLKLHCSIADWDNSYRGFPKATWDLSNDPDFIYSEQKVFPIITRCEAPGPDY